MRKKGKHFFVALDTNLFSAATFPLRLCTSFTFLGGFISIMARILSEFASIPLCDTINPRNFPAVTPKAALTAAGEEGLLALVCPFEGFLQCAEEGQTFVRRP